MFGLDLQRLHSDCEGSASVEYLALLALVAISISAGLYLLGQGLIERYRFMSALLSLPVP